MEQIVVVKYETSNGLVTLEFNNGENIVTDVDENRGVIYIEEHIQNQRNKLLAIISLKQFVSFSIKEIKL